MSTSLSYSVSRSLGVAWRGVADRGTNTIETIGHANDAHGCTLTLNLYYA